MQFNKQDRFICRKKRSFQSVDEAMSAAYADFRESGIKLDYYPCRHCGRIHLTSALAQKQVTIHSGHMSYAL